MKIRKIEPILVGERHLFVKVHTDEGIVGLGESGLWGSREGVIGTLKRMEPAILGQDVSRISYINEKLYAKHQFKGINVMSAIACIDLALWDIKGKVLGVPVYELLGGKFRDRIRVWKPIVAQQPEAIREEALRAKEEKYTAVRINPCGGTGEMTTIARLNTIYRRVEAIRDAVGEELDIGIEIHRDLNPDDTVRVCNLLDPLKILFYEDPHRSENVEILKYVSDKTTAPLAAGERCVSIQEFETLFHNGLRLARPDVCTLGGLTGAKKVCTIAEVYHAGVMPHVATSVINIAASLHMSAAIPNFTILELGPERHYNMVLDSMGDYKFKIVDGYMEIPQAPGWGVELADDIASRYPYATTEWKL